MFPEWRFQRGQVYLHISGLIYGLVLLFLSNCRKRNLFKFRFFYRSFDLKSRFFFLQNKTINWQISLWHIFVMYFSTCFFFTWKERFDTSTVHRIEVMSVSKLSPILEKLTLHYPSIVSYTALASSIVFWGICDFETNFNELAYGNRQCLSCRMDRHHLTVANK